RAQKRAAGTKECCLMSAVSKRTRARELAEQLRARIAPQSWQWLRHVLRGILEGQPHEAAAKAANLARLPYPGRRILRWPGVPCWDPVEYVQLHNGSWRHIDQVPLPPPLDPQFERLVASPWVRDARAADVRTDVRGCEGLAAGMC